MSNKKHTPLPYYLQDFDYCKKILIMKKVEKGSSILIASIDTKDGDTPSTPIQCKLEEEQAKANANFVVRACNSHYELVEVCKEARELLCKSDIGIESGSKRGLIIKIGESIAKVETIGE